MSVSSQVSIIIVGAMITAAIVSVPFLTIEPATDAVSQADPAPATRESEPAPVLQDPDVSLPSDAPRFDAASDPSGEMSLAEIFEMAEPGVVRINVQRVDLGGSSTGQTVGSGFVFDTAGNIITNAHVVRDAQKVTVTFLDGRSYNADVIGADESADVAVIRVDADPSLLHPLVIGDSSDLRVGDSVAAIGNPFGLSGSMTSGIVSQLGRLIPSSTGFSIPDVIQTDTAINPGNSGGPLLNLMGETVGINTAIQSVTGEFAGIGFAVPSQTFTKIVPILIETGRYQHPWVGISGTDIYPDLADVLGLDDAIGFLIVAVIEDSPASAAGLRGSDEIVNADGVDYSIGGDIILSVDGNEVRKIDDILIHLQREKAAGDEMVLGILRDGQAADVTITLQARP